MINQEKLNKYANLIVQRGVHIEKGDTLLIFSEVHTAEFARLVTQKAYEAGAYEVIVRYKDEQIARLTGLYADDAIFDTYDSWQAEFYREYVDRDAKILHLDSSNPEALKGVEPTKLMRMQKAAQLPLKAYRDKLMSDNMTWSIAGVPNIAWAEKVFPEVDSETAVEQLWDAIFKTVHLDDLDDPIAAWDAHANRLRQAVKQMNAYNFRELHYTNSLGTDLHVGLPTGHIWEGGMSTNKKTGVPFNANMPTEEVFTLPDCNHVNGTVYSSKPLSYSGNLIDNFGFEFKDGRVVHVFAETGKEMLEEMISADSGAKRLGEVALVPFHSPISMMDRIFYDTLYDENASCHLALGAAYQTTLAQTAGKSEAELEAMGFNSSLIHVDFMIGTEDLQIIGITQDGQEIPVFIDGDFAF